MLHVPVSLATATVTLLAVGFCFYTGCRLGNLRGRLRIQIPANQRSSDLRQDPQKRLLGAAASGLTNLALLVLASAGVGARLAGRLSGLHSPAAAR